MCVFLEVADYDEKQPLCKLILFGKEWGYLSVTTSYSLKLFPEQIVCNNFIRVTSCHLAFVAF